MELKQNFYKLKCTGTLKNGLEITTTFEVNFDKKVRILDSEEYKTTKREIMDIISLVLSNYYLKEK